MGISPDHCVDILDPFTQKDASTQRDFSGSGLGLAICDRMIEHMGGRLEVESEEGVGSTFFFDLALRLPLKGDQAEATDRLIQGGGETDRSFQMKVLVVEDNPINQVVVTSQLGELNIEWDLCSNGLQALNAVAGKTYHLILMDCQMPELDGYEATRQIRRQESHGQRMVIVGLTANASEENRQRCLAVGMDECLTKPVTLADLTDLMDRYEPNDQSAGSGDCLAPSLRERVLNSRDF